MIQIRVDQSLVEKGRTFYWLAKETGISHTTLWRLKKGKALGINFETLEKMCQALECQPGDLLALVHTDARKKANKDGQNRRVSRKKR
jgi:putative transcriptional regulator